MRLLCYRLIHNIISNHHNSNVLSEVLQNYNVYFNYIYIIQITNDFVFLSIVHGIGSSTISIRFYWWDKKIMVVFVKENIWLVNFILNFIIVICYDDVINYIIHFIIYMLILYLYKLEK
jgi:hypothetical protein